MVDPLRLLRRLLSGGNDDEVGADPAAAEPRTATDGGPSETGETGEFVYECPGCGEVYISEAPHTCSSCGETTASVPPTDD